MTKRPDSSPDSLVSISAKIGNIQRQALSVDNEHDQQIEFGNLLMAHLVKLGAHNRTVQQAIDNICKRLSICNKPTAMFRIKTQAQRALNKDDFTTLRELAKALEYLKKDFPQNGYQIVEDYLIAPVSALAIADVAQKVQQAIDAKIG